MTVHLAPSVVIRSQEMDFFCSKIYKNKKTKEKLTWVDSYNFLLVSTFPFYINLSPSGIFSNKIFVYLKKKKISSYTTDPASWYGRIPVVNRTLEARRLPSRETNTAVTKQKNWINSRKNLKKVKKYYKKRENNQSPKRKRTQRQPLGVLPFSARTSIKRVGDSWNLWETCREKTCW